MTLTEILKAAELDFELMESIKFEPRYSNWHWHIYAVVTDIEGNVAPEVYVSQL